MPVVVVATLKAKPESVETVREAGKAALSAVHEEPGCRAVLPSRGRGRHVHLRRAVGRCRSAEGAQQGTRCCDVLRRNRRAPRRRTGHQDAPDRRRRRPGQGCAAALMGSLNGKVAFITGAARGQGRAEAVRLASDGANIIAVDICDQIASVPYPMATPDDLAATVKLVSDTGARIVAREADVRDRDGLSTALQAGLDEFGRLDIVIANAGIAPMEAGVDAWRDVLDVNLTGAFHTAEVAIPTMVNQGDGGVIVLISSVAGLVPMNSS